MSPGFDEVVRRVWPDGHSSFEVLGGGITNHNLKVTRPEGTYVLRISGKDTELLGIDRSVEVQATRAAAAVGVGPAIRPSTSTAAAVSRIETQLTPTASGFSGSTA